MVTYPEDKQEGDPGKQLGENHSVKGGYQSKNRIQSKNRWLEITIFR